MLIQASPFLRCPVTMGAALLPSVTSFPGLELYLDSRLGMSGFADGAAVNLWPDQSGHSPARDALQATPANKPIMRRTGASISANGQPMVAFNGNDNGHWMTSANPNPGLAITNGYTIFAYGRFKPAPAGNSLKVSTLWCDSTGFRPDFSYEDANGDRKWSIDTECGLKEGPLFGSQPIYGSVAWILTDPASCVTARGNVYANQSLITTQVWSWNPLNSAGYNLGSLNFSNGHAFMDLGAILYFSRDISLSEMSILQAIFRRFFG